MNGFLKAGLTGASIVCASSAGLTFARARANKNGAPLGRPGSDIHVLTNDKLDLKAFTKDKAIADAKRGVKLACIVGGISTIAGLTTKASKGLSDTLHYCKSIAGDICAQINLGKYNLKTMITNTSEYKAIDKVPKPLKAAACVGFAVLMATLPSVNAARNASNAYLEAKHETK